MSSYDTRGAMRYTVVHRIENEDVTYCYGPFDVLIEAEAFAGKHRLDGAIVEELRDPDEGVY